MTKPLFALLLLLAVFTACEQSDDDHSIDPSPRIRTITSRSFEGIVSQTTFEYDSLGRIDKVLGMANATEKYHYFADSLIVVNHYKNGTMESFDSLWLNDQGLVASKKSLETTVGGIPVIRFTIRNTYEYNAEGFLVKWSPGDHVYEIEDGNTVKEILFTSNHGFPWPGQDSTAVKRVVYAFVKEFIPNSLNTIGNENKGMAFWGKQDKNLASSWQNLPLDNPFGGEYKGNITYQLDARQRVITKISDKSLDPYTQYTYY